MIYNFLRLWFKHVKQDKFLFTLNFLSFVLGITSSIIIFAFVFQQVSFDNFHDNYKNIYRLTTIFTQQGKESRYALNEGKWDLKLATDVNGVISSTAFLPTGEMLFVHQNVFFPQANGFYVDENFLETFDFPLISGDRLLALKDPSAIVITRKIAEKLFGSTNIVGKSLSQKTSAGLDIYTITAVLEDLPVNSSLQFDVLIRGSGTWWEEQFEGGQGNTMHIYFRMNSPEPIKNLQTKIDRAFAIKNDPSGDLIYKTPIETFESLHFNAYAEFDIIQPISKNYVFILTFIGIGIVLISIINYINLTLAKSATRFKEMGVRKSIGASSRDISVQILSESIFFFVATTVFALVLTYAVVSFSSSLIRLDLNYVLSAKSFLAIFLISIVIGGLSAIYPATYINRLKAPALLKGHVLSTLGSMFSIKTTVVGLQIITSVSLLAIALVIFKHIHHLQNKPLGYSKNNLVYFVRPDDISQGQWTSFYDQLKSQSVFKNVGGSFYPLLTSMNKALMKVNEQKSFTSSWNQVNIGFIETMNMEMLEGRAFDERFPGDSSAVIINQAAKSALGEADVLGKKISFWRGEFEIVGVVNDFHFQSFNQIIEPVVFVRSVATPRVIYARAHEIKNSRSREASLEAMRSAKFDRDIDVLFFEDWFNALLTAELQMRHLIIGFTIISLFLSAIGVYALMHTVNHQYRRQVSIRKIYGASRWNVVFLVTKKLAITVLVSFLISVPLVIYATDLWQSQFSYKAPSIGTEIVLSYCIIVSVVFAVVFKQVIQSMSKKPIDILRAIE